MGLACGGVLEGGDGKRVLSRGWLRRSGEGGSRSGLARGCWGGGRSNFYGKVEGVRLHGYLPRPRPGKFRCCVALATVGVALGGSP